LFPHPNGLIAQLSTTDQALLMKNARLMEFKQGDVLTRAHEVQSSCFFLTRGAVALFVPADPPSLDHGLAVGLIGCEGAVGLQALWGMPSGHFSGLVQSNGYAYELAAEPLRRMVQSRPHWRELFSRYLWTLYQDIAQLAAYSQTQDVSARLADWLLRSADRCAADDVVMTHAHIAHMLGVRRASITQAAKVMKDKAWLRYARGQITLLDREGLASTLGRGKSLR
jgi:CRP-like cAMP-binding protein